MSRERTLRVHAISRTIENAIVRRADSRVANIPDESFLAAGTGRKFVYLLFEAALYIAEENRAASLIMARLD